jgi:formamidopyrimidine-DNA glycosylase
MPEGYVYQAGACRRCGGSIRDFPFSGSRMFVCAHCQPRRPLAFAGKR